MRRHLLAVLFLACAPLAIGQVAPGPQQTPTQPGSSQQQPGAPQPQPGTDPTTPNAVPGAPPTFVPGIGAGDNTPAPQPKVVRISGGVMAGNNLSKVPPVYPEDAKAAGVEGTVMLSARIGRDGHVKSLAVVSGPQPLQSAAVDAVKQWVYRPYVLNGQPVDVSTVITVNFNLR